MANLVWRAWLPIRGRTPCQRPETDMPTKKSFGRPCGGSARSHRRDSPPGRAGMRRFGEGQASKVTATTLAAGHNRRPVSNSATLRRFRAWLAPAVSEPCRAPSSFLREAGSGPSPRNTRKGQKHQPAKRHRRPTDGVPDVHFGDVDSN
jgi:hypothetical protein